MVAQEEEEEEWWKMNTEDGANGMDATYHDEEGNPVAVVRINMPSDSKEKNGKNWVRIIRQDQKWSYNTFDEVWFLDHTIHYTNSNYHSYQHSLLDKLYRYYTILLSWHRPRLNTPFHQHPKQVSRHRTFFVVYRLAHTF